MLSELILKQIAHAAYEAVRAWDTDHGVEKVPTWEKAGRETQQQVIERVSRTLSDPRAGDATFHNEHLAQMKKEGWTSGSEYSEGRRTDPNLVAFHLLSPELQARERLIRAVILALSRV